MNNNKLKMIQIMKMFFLVVIQLGILETSIASQTICEDLPNIDYPQPYPVTGWNQFDVGSDDGIEGNGALSFTLDSMVNRNNVNIGLDHDPSASIHWNTIDHAFYIIRNSTNNIVRIYENGSFKGTFVNTVNSINGYQFKIQRTGDQVQYFINDELKFTSTVSSTDHLYYDNACLRRNANTKFSASQIKICVPGPPDVSTIMANSAYVDGKIRLRWMATEMSIWEHALKVGYTIERITVAENGNYLSKNERLDSYVRLEENYLPKSLSELEAATSNANQGTLANILVNDTNTQESIMGVGAGEQTLAKAVEQKNMRDIRYFYSHVLAEKSFELACAMGMAYEDNTIEANKEYTYLITLSQPIN